MTSRLLLLDVGSTWTKAALVDVGDARIVATAAVPTTLDPDVMVGVRAARQVATLAPDGASSAATALRWVVDQPGVTTVIPGARNPSQAQRNAAAGQSELPAGFADAVRKVYDEKLRADIHPRW